MVIFEVDNRLDASEIVKSFRIEKARYDKVEAAEMKKIEETHL